MTSGETILAQLHMEAEVVRWERALRDAGIAHLFLKGIGFDIWLGRADKRVSRDIDVLCPRPMRRRVERLLKSEGFRCIVTEPNASTWIGPEGRVPIDLHETLKGATVAPDAVWRALAPLITREDVAGVAVPFLGPPARELLVGLHVVFAGLADERAVSDLRAASERTALETWRAADELARQLGCRALFEAAFCVNDDLRTVAGALGFSMIDAEELLVSRPGRDDAFALLTAVTSQGARERALLITRFLHLHTSRLGQDYTPDPGSPPVQRMLHRARSLPRIAFRLCRRLMVAAWCAWRLRRVVRERENARRPKA